MLHVLPAGSQFDLADAHPDSPTTTPVPDHEVVEARAAEADLRTLAEEIAAEGVSPAHYARRVRRRVPYGVERHGPRRGTGAGCKDQSTSRPEEPTPMESTASDRRSPT